jgi:hypothetical protein
MATVLSEYTTEEQRSVVRFLWAKALNTKDIHKEMFPVYGLKCLSRKAVHNWVEKFSQGCSKVADDGRPGAEVAETTDKNFHAADFDALIKRCWRICRKINVFFSGSNITCFMLKSTCDSPSYVGFEVLTAMVMKSLIF